jgi:DNA-directed RNA polymerase specialized sigma24 family protein
MHRPLTDADVVTFVLAGCNAAEIAAYAGVEIGTAIALMVRARQQIARAA